MTVSPMLLLPASAMIMPGNPRCRSSITQFLAIFRVSCAHGAAAFRVNMATRQKAPSSSPPLPLFPLLCLLLPLLSLSVPPLLPLLSLSPLPLSLSTPSPFPPPTSPFSSPCSRPPGRGSPGVSVPAPHWSDRTQRSPRPPRGNTSAPSSRIVPGPPCPKFLQPCRTTEIDGSSATARGESDVRQQPGASHLTRKYPVYSSLQEPFMECPRRDDGLPARICGGMLGACLGHAWGIAW